jgi:Tfp pilus assembly protein PilX
MMVITLLTVMLAAAFILVSADYRTTLNAFASARALALAQAGLQNYFSVGHNLLAVSTDSTSYTFSGGYAAVVAHELRDSTTTTPRQPALWVITSFGFDTVRALSGQPNGQRSVAQFATLQPGALPARAAMVAPNGVDMIATPAGGNPFNGLNFGFTIAGCTIPANADTMGLTTPAGSYTGTGGNDVNGVRGVGASIEFLGSAAATVDSTRIDWAKLVGGQFTPDFVGVLPPAGNSTYQSHYFVGDLTVPTGQRRGLLVVTGNVSFSSGAHWDGVIVSGGDMDFGGNYVVILHGMAISGLNGTLTKNRVRRNTGSIIQWDWCYAHTSIASLMYLVPIKNAWVDTWSTY